MARPAGGTLDRWSRPAVGSDNAGDPTSARFRGARPHGREHGGAPSRLGVTVHGEERSREHAQALIEKGLLWRDTPREVAQSADVVITSLPNDNVLEEVASGPDGILAGLTAGKT